VGSLFSEGRASARPISSDDRLLKSEDVRKHVPPTQTDFWENYRRLAESLPPSAEGTWEYISDGEQIDAIEASSFAPAASRRTDRFSIFESPHFANDHPAPARFPATPNAWTWLIFPIPIVASLILAQGTYWSFAGDSFCSRFFSILDGCDGEIARAKFMESQRAEN